MEVERLVRLSDISQQLYHHFLSVSFIPDDRIWRATERVAQIIELWGLPDECTAATYILPILATRPDERERLEVSLNPEVVRLAAQVLEWRKHLMALEYRPTGYDLESEFALRLCELLRQIYIDYPDFKFILLLMAFHEADLNDTEPLSLYLARLSLGVFIPLAEILDLWVVREEWLEICVPIELNCVMEADRRSDVALYQYILKILKRLESPNIESNQLSSPVPSRSGEQIKPNILSEKEYALSDLRQRLSELAQQQGIACTPEVELRTHRAGSLFFRAKEAESKRNFIKTRSAPETMLNELWVRIICESEDDCYRVLGYLHSLGKPVDPLFSEHFHDYIADPQPNGYRGIQTALIFLKDGDRTGFRNSDILVEARILTQQMRKINLWGVIEAFYRNPQIITDNDKYRFAWWHPDQMKKLCNRLNETRSATPDYKSFSDYLRESNLNTRSPLLYIFTPKGQIRLMEDNSSALDFAYEIHSEIGNHASRILVNQKTVSYGHRLRNGDMVQVNYDPNFHGADISWLAFVNTRKAKKQIRLLLSSNSTDPNPGKAEIEEAFAHAIRIYHTQKDYNLNLTTRRLNQFLERYAKQLEMSSLEELYAQIQIRKGSGQEAPKQPKKKIAAERIIRRLIAEELSGSLVDHNSHPLYLPFYRINFCEKCRPVPGERIFGAKKVINKKTKEYEITVHTSPCSLFELIQAKAQENGFQTEQIPLDWVGKSDYSSEMLAEYEITARNRFRLLEDVLEVVYHTPNSEICDVQARPEADGNAYISIILSNPDPDALISILPKLEEIEDVTNVTPHPVSPYHPSVTKFQHVLNRARRNPFLEGPVDSPAEFYGREMEVAAIKAWVQDPQGVGCLILHGQGRVGKTSLGMYLVKTIFFGHHTVLPVMVDLRRFNCKTADDFAEFLLAEISVQRNISTPERLLHENPARWVERTLGEIAKKEGFQHFLVILDEFDTLMDAVDRSEVDPRVLRSFSSLLKTASTVRWLIIINEVTYKTPPTESGAAILKRGTPLYLDRLTDEDAVRYICETLAEASLAISMVGPNKKECTKGNPIIRRIFELSGGIPFFVKQIGNNLPLDYRLNQPRSITLRDVDKAVETVLLNGPVIFHHYMRALKDNQRIILETLAQCSVDQDWVSVEELQLELRKNKRNLRGQFVLNDLIWMSQLAVINLETHDSHTYVRIPVKIFSIWLRSPHCQ